MFPLLNFPYFLLPQSFTEVDAWYLKKFKFVLGHFSER